MLQKIPDTRGTSFNYHAPNKPESIRLKGDFEGKSRDGEVLMGILEELPVYFRQGGEVTRRLAWLLREREREREREERGRVMCFFSFQLKTFCFEVFVVETVVSLPFNFTRTSTPSRVYREEYRDELN